MIASRPVFLMLSTISALFIASCHRFSAGGRSVRCSFDAAAPELVAAYLILALYWTQQMDSAKINRYIGLAHQSNDIISDSPGALVASLTFVSVILYDAKVSKKSAAGDERLAQLLASVCSILAGRSA